MSKPLLLLITLITTLTTCYSEAEVNGMFVFGSSILDSGNNNYLPNTTARADYLPYGLDFPLGPTGRFSNARNIIDVLGALLGLPSLIPVFNDPQTRGDKVIHGVNYASGGSGILNSTGSISTLYSLGARKFVLLNINPNGCAPVVTIQTSGLCVEPINAAILLFNARLRLLVDRLRPSMLGSKLIYINAYKIIRDIIDDPTHQEEFATFSLDEIPTFEALRLTCFAEVKQPCCKVSSNGLCERGGSVCQSRNSYLYFDGIHVTDAVNALIARKAYETNSIIEAYPINVKQLARL
ncbi:GDSL esterase/lipase [Acorus calamus]|uniref:GDSL esterase/lipase n=1 Tax=Acorus calamus TaxID=4465 RepID=A0AAV9CPS3_ACOCL|nr:GDSL esterase/lipase [Acorus calamus]